MDVYACVDVGGFASKGNCDSWLEQKNWKFIFLNLCLDSWKEQGNPYARSWWISNSGKKTKKPKKPKKKTTKNKRPTSEKWKARIAEPNKNKSRSVFRYSIVISKHSPVNPNLCAYLINIKHNGACQMNQNLKKLVGLSSISSRSQGTLTWNSFHVTNKATSCDQEPAREFLLKFSFFFHREIPFSPRPPITKHLLAWLDREAFYGRRHEPWRRAISATFAHKLTGPTVPLLLLRPAKTRPHQHH